MTEPTGKADKRGKAIDWESVETLYRAGAASLRAIGKQFSVSEAMIRKKAKESGWERDLTERVRNKVRSELVRTQVEEVRTTRNLRTEAEVVEAVADFQVEVLRTHQVLAQRGRRVTQIGMDELEMHATDRAELMEKISQTEDLEERKRLRNQMAATFPGWISQVAAAGNMARSWITLEREAFNIPGDSLPPPAPPTPLEDLDDDELDKQIAAKAREGGISLAAVRESAKDS